MAAAELGNCTAHIDPLGDETRFEYTYFDLLTARTTPDGVRHQFGHDTELRLTQVTNPQGLSWSYSHDAAGRLVKEADFDDRTLTYRHDVAGRLVARTNALGETTVFERNTLGQIVRKDALARSPPTPTTRAVASPRPLAPTVPVCPSPATSTDSSARRAWTAANSCMTTTNWGVASGVPPPPGRPPRGRTTLRAAPYWPGRLRPLH